MVTPEVSCLSRRVNLIMKPMCLLLAMFRLQIQRPPTKKSRSRSWNINPQKSQNP